jgi:threonine/homoserine/homoserine lactone efflux protein
VAAILTFPIIHAALTILSLAYLLWLAWAIGSAPLSGSIGTDGPSNAFTPAGGFMLGFANPKAYLAFSSLFGSFAILMPAYGFADGLLKWGTCVLVMALVDFAWLVAGVGLGRITIGPRTERAINVAAACTILLACLAALR